MQTVNKIDHYEVEYAEPSRPDQWLNYGPLLRHHGPKTYDQAIMLAIEYMRDGKLVQIRDEDLPLEFPIIQIIRAEARNVFLGSSDPHVEEHEQMCGTLDRLAKDIKDNYTLFEIPLKAGNGQRWPITNNKSTDIEVARVEVLFGGLFDLSLIDLIDSINTNEEKVIKKIISRPHSRVYIEINETIERDHGLAFRLNCSDDRRFSILVVYKEVPPRRMAPGGPLGLSD